VWQRVAWLLPTGRNAVVPGGRVAEAAGASTASRFAGWCSELPARHRAQPFLLALPPLLLAAWVWHPLVDNYFYEDDFINLFQICTRPLTEYLFEPHGGHLYLLRNSVFYAFARLFGTNAHAYFTVVWLVHLGNVALLFRALERFTGSAWIASACATLFGTCPAVEGTLGWYSVFGHALAGTMLLLILADVASLRSRGLVPGRVRQSVWAMLALSGMISFGVGVGIAAALPIALMLLLPRPAGRWLPPLWPLLLAVPTLYFALSWIAARWGPPTEVVGQARALTGIAAVPVSAVLELWVGLIAYGIDCLLAGPVPLPKYPSLPGVLIAAGFTALVLWGALRAHDFARRLLLAAVVLTLACYGTIAAGRVQLMGLVGIANFVAQARYYYVGVLTLAVALGAILMALAAAVPALSLVRGRVLVAWLALWWSFFWVWPIQIDHHDAARSDVYFLLAWMRSLARETPEDQNVYIMNQRFRGVTWLFSSGRDFPGWAGLFAIYFPDPTIDGRRVFFVESDASVRAAHKTARRLAGAMVAPEDVPPRPDPFTPLKGICPVPAGALESGRASTVPATTPANTRSPLEWLPGGSDANGLAESP